MGEKDPQLNNLQNLLQEDERLVHSIERARDEDEVTSLINRAGERQGFKFEPRWLKDVYVDIKVARKPITFTREELLELASTANTMDSAPKTCHSDSCGGGHKGCC
jgi:hypothetical protein